MEIVISKEIREAAPGYRVIVVEADVTNYPTSDVLWSELLAEGERVRGRLATTAGSDTTEAVMPMINKRPAIAATRAAYKALGKEPNRYRPSAEALSRRIVKGMELYRINALVDIINLISLRTGYSIGGFDLDRIEGDTLTLGVGREGEPFEGIGRGPLNIAGLPVFRDAVGGIGTPTSDNERTKLTEPTRRLLMTINIYGEETPADETVALARDLLTRYCDLTSMTIKEYKAADENS